MGARRTEVPTAYRPAVRVLATERSLLSLVWSPCLGTAGLPVTHTPHGRPPGGFLSGTFLAPPIAAHWRRLDFAASFGVRYRDGRECDRPVQDRADPPARTVAHPRSGGDRHARVHRLVQLLRFTGRAQNPSLKVSTEPRAVQVELLAAGAVCKVVAWCFRR